jgi:hypothetical protein
VKLSISIFGDKLVERDLLRLAGKAGNAKPAFEEIGHNLQDIFAATFESQGRRGGGSWMPLSPSRIRQKIYLELDPRIEYASYALLKSLSWEGNSMGIFRARSDYIEIGSKLPYARRQHKGDLMHHLPARPLIKMTEGDRKAQVKTLQRFLMEAWRVV